MYSVCVCVCLERIVVRERRENDFHSVRRRSRRKHRVGTRRRRDYYRKIRVPTLCLRRKRNKKRQLLAAQRFRRCRTRITQRSDTMRRL